MNESIYVKKAPKILVTGASGFLGRRIVEELVAEDSSFPIDKIVALDILPYSGGAHSKLQCIQGDITNSLLIDELTKDIDMVIHSAAIIDWGTKPESFVLDTNLHGTQNIIQACKKNGVKHLLYTSSLDAVYTGKALRNISEEQPYPAKHANVYCESKHLSELEVAQANSASLTTCILRPCDIFGERDPYHIPPLINMAKSGFYVRLGDGSSKCQHVYVGNMAYAHVLAAKELYYGNHKLAGQIYFITDGEGENFFSFYDQIVSGAGYSILPKNMWIPKKLAYAMGALSEWTAIAMRPIKKYNPNFSRFAVSYTCTDFTFSSAKAERDFGYRAKYDHKQALDLTIEFYKKHTL
jgi:nucleoside-diphosphate-sugar epimerase